AVQPGVAECQGADFTRAAAAARRDEGRHRQPDQRGHGGRGTPGPDLAAACLRDVVRRDRALHGRLHRLGVPRPSRSHHGRRHQGVPAGPSQREDPEQRRRLETIGDLTVSAGLGVGQVALNRIPGSAVGLNIAASGAYGVVETVAYQLRDDKPGVDWQQAAFAGTANAGGAVLGHVMGLPAGRFPNAGAAESQFFQAAVAASSGSTMDAATQYATTGQVDPLQALAAAGHGVVGSFTGISAPRPEPLPAPPAEPADAPGVRADGVSPVGAPPFAMPDLPEGIVSPRGMAALEQLFGSGATPTFNQAVRWRDDIGAALET